MNFLIEVLTLLRLKPIIISSLNVIAKYLPRNQICAREGVRLHCDLDQLIERSFFLFGVWELKLLRSKDTEISEESINELSEAGLNNLY